VTAPNIDITWTRTTVYRITANAEKIRALLLTALTEHEHRDTWHQRITAADTTELAEILTHLDDTPNFDNPLNGTQILSWLDDNEPVGDDDGPEIDTATATTQRATT
jgi:hypothetical protein